jgi:hypothetical protein
VIPNPKRKTTALARHDGFAFFRIDPYALFSLHEPLPHILVHGSLGDNACQSEHGDTERKKRLVNEINRVCSNSKSAVDFKRASGREIQENDDLCTNI